jgi:hypothetical protein
MESRKFERKKYRFRAYFISGNTKYFGFVENFSKEGISLTTAPTTSPINFSSHTTHKIQLDLPSGETLTISGEVERFHTETSSHGLIYKMGIKIINPPIKYKAFLKTYD